MVCSNWEGGNGVYGVNLPLMQSLAKPASDYANATDSSTLPNVFATIFSTIACPTISITKANDTTGPVAPGTAVGYTLTLHVTNGPVASATVVDQLPADMGAPTSILPSGTYDSTPNTITWSLSNVTDGQTLTYTAVVAASATNGEALTNSATITDGPRAGDGCSSNSTVTVVVTPPSPTISITKANDTTGPVAPGTAVGYTLTLHVTNGPVASATVVDQLPADVGAPTSILPSGTYDSTPNTITWSLSNVTDGQTLTYTAVVAASATNGEALTNSATITDGPCAGDGCSSNSTVTVVVTPPSPGQPNVSIAKLVNGAKSVTITGGQTSTLTYTIQVQNTGDAASTTPFVLTDNDFPAFFTGSPTVTCTLNNVSQTCSYADLTGSGIDLGFIQPGDTWNISVSGSATPNTGTDVGSSPHVNAAYPLPGAGSVDILGRVPARPADRWLPHQQRLRLRELHTPSASAGHPPGPEDRDRQGGQPDPPRRGWRIGDLHLHRHQPRPDCPHQRHGHRQQVRAAHVRER